MLAFAMTTLEEEEQKAQMRSMPRGLCLCLLEFSFSKNSIPFGHQMQLGVFGRV